VRLVPVIREAETYEAGTTIKHAGQTLTVLADLGDAVEFSVHESPLRGGEHLHIPVGTPLRSLSLISHWRY
jgi:hypothetical protein